MEVLFSFPPGLGSVVEESAEKKQRERGGEKKRYGKKESAVFARCGGTGVGSSAVLRSAPQH